MFNLTKLDFKVCEPRVNSSSLKLLYRNQQKLKETIFLDKRKPKILKRLSYDIFHYIVV